MTTTNQEDTVSEQTAAADPFAAGATADPFANAPAPDNGETPVAPESAEEIPTVNAEGERVDPETGEPLAQPEAAAPAVEEAPAPEPQPAEAGDGQPPQEPPAAPAEAAEPPEAASAPEEAPQAPEEPQAPPPAAEEPQPAAEEPQPPAPAPSADEGKSPFRHYKLLYQTGEAIWTEYDLTKLAADMKQHAESVDGEMFLRARNADHARRIAWILFDRPANGVTVNPVAKSSWNPKRLAPAPPKPERERLSIT